MNCTLANLDDNLIPLFAIVGGILVAVVAIISAMVKSASTRRQIEESRREIAAYVAEGSISPDDAERLINAGPKDRCG